MGAVGLIVADLNRSLRFYHESIGLHIHRRSDGQAWLGANAEDLLVLTEQSGARPVQRGVCGLYHFALLLPSRRELARTLRHLVDTRTPLSGLSDHAVSEAIYLQDPDGHGIEIYADRPREQWPPAMGALQMTVEPLDVPDLLSEVTAGKVVWHGLHAGSVVGHVHLHVSSLSQAERFYCETLGFALQQRMLNQASFVAAGGYHHHLGLNIWAGAGAPPPPADAARLAWFEVVLPSSADFDALIDRLRSADVAMEITEGYAELRDPSSLTVRLVDGARRSLA
jgi:catechol 2,3-dioxygenase